MSKQATFYMVVGEANEPFRERFLSLDEARETAERLSRSTGQCSFVLKAVAQAAVHKVEWSDLDEMPPPKG